MTNELLQKAKACKSADELLALAKENNMEMTAKEAAETFAQLQAVGEISDDELDNVSGGGCYRPDGRLVVTTSHSCFKFRCEDCGGNYYSHHQLQGCGLKSAICMNCKFMSYENGLWLCNHEENRK